MAWITERMAHLSKGRSSRQDKIPRKENPKLLVEMLNVSIPFRFTVSS